MRATRWFRAIDPRRSIIMKIFLTFLAMTFCATVTVRWGAQRVFEQSLTGDWLRPVLEHYLELVERSVLASSQPAQSLQDFAGRFQLQAFWQAHDKSLTLGNALVPDGDFPRGAESSRPPHHKWSEWKRWGSSTRWKFSRSAAGVVLQHTSHLGVWQLATARGLQINSIALGILIVALLALIAGTFAITQHFVSPLRSIKRGLEDFAGGNFQARLPVRGKDEWALLSQSFNEMAARISEEITVRDRLLADVSHELRSPLTRLRVAAELLEKSHERERIVTDIDDLRHLTDQLLESFRFSHGESAPLEELSLGDLRQMLLHLAKQEGLSLNEIGRKDNPPPQPDFLVSCNTHLTRIVLKNILENVRKHATNSLRVEIEFLLENELPHAPHNPSLILTLSDHGPAPAETEIAQLNRPFYRPDPARSRSTGGHGLGLHLAKRLQIAQNGSLSLGANKRGGLTVALTFSTENHLSSGTTCTTPHNPLQS